MLLNLKQTPQNLLIFKNLPAYEDKLVSVKKKKSPETKLLLSTKCSGGNGFVHWNVTYTASISKSVFQMKKWKKMFIKLDIKDFATHCGFCYIRQEQYLP